ncbi:hypothetical protein Back2_15700 [Nocardioides baekrokdamisoli]|uniref:DUF4393 domain-containing protein n=1 Tax=Nocardioides baekrokdamisoli TaxID=1804624 RepID=A0A3G9IXZ4_9ACTN|nr:Abi-alpha family protein [Nocardioides baekrokdamisoli]BBH17283.1 hypothetical protein Back2_15700 [Nocardioides baekrokdamisoli]
MAGARKKETPQTNGGLVLTSGLGLARIGATTLVRTAGWGVTQYSKGARRIAQAAVDPIAAAELADDVAKVTGQVADFARAVTANTPLAGAAEFGAILLDRAKGIAEQLGTGEPVEQSDSDRLRRAGEDLLRRSRDVWHEEERHPAFEGILKSIAPDEARMLVLLLKEGPQPTVDVIVSNSKRVLASGLSMIGGRASLRSPDSIPTYLINLTRLGLVWESDDPVKDLLRYQVVEAQPDVLEAARSVRRSKVLRKSLHLTPFGVDFAVACFADFEGLVDRPQHAVPADPDPLRRVGD